MKKIIIFLIISLTTLIYSSELSDLSFSSSIGFEYNKLKILNKENNNEYDFSYSFINLGLKSDIFDFLTAKAFVGFAINTFKNKIVLQDLPISINIDNLSLNSLIMGLNLNSNPFDIGDVSVYLDANLIYLKSFNKSEEINFDIAKGNLKLSDSFLNIRGLLYFTYEGFDDFTPLLGFGIDYLNGRINSTQEIEDVKGDGELRFKNKSLFFLQAGVTYYLSESIYIDAVLKLFSRTSVLIRLNYDF